MRHALLILAGLAGLAGCTYAERNQISANPPTVSYRVQGNDISQANVSAQQYCQRYNLGAQYQGLQATPTGNVALYSCGGSSTGVSGSTVPPSPYATVAPPPYSEPQVICADPMHQNRPGGSDYSGPAVPGCPPTRY